MVALTAMGASEIATAIITAITSGLTGLVSAIPTAIKDTFVNLFFTSSTMEALSPMAIICLVFGGIALAFGLSKLVWHLVTKKIGA